MCPPPQAWKIPKTAATASPGHPWVILAGGSLISWCGNILWSQHPIHPENYYILKECVGLQKSLDPPGFGNFVGWFRANFWGDLSMEGRQDLRSELLLSKDFTFSGIKMYSYCNLRTEGESYKSQYAFYSIISIDMFLGGRCFLWNRMFPQFPLAPKKHKLASQSRKRWTVLKPTRRWDLRKGQPWCDTWLGRSYQQFPFRHHPFSNFQIWPATFRFAKKYSFQMDGNVSKAISAFRYMGPWSSFCKVQKIPQRQTFLYLWKIHV